MSGCDECASLPEGDAVGELGSESQYAFRYQLCSTFMENGDSHVIRLLHAASRPVAIAGTIVRLHGLANNGALHP